MVQGTAVGSLNFTFNFNVNLCHDLSINTGYLFAHPVIITLAFIFIVGKINKTKVYGSP